MRIGILADIHESLDSLRWALGVLKSEGVDRLVVLGDVCGMADGLEETVALLAEAGAGGVWGNHDFGLCHTNVTTDDHRRYSERVLEFMAGLRPRVEIDGCLFTHVEPWLDPEKIEDLWNFDGPAEDPDRMARSFASSPHRVMMMGHLHRWLVATPEGVDSWSGEGAIVLNAGRRHLVAVHAVCLGRCALFDTVTNELIPFVADRAR